MSDGMTTWLVRMTYRAPHPDKPDGAPIDVVKQERATEHSAAHGIARRWATSILPAGAIDPAIEIERRDGARIVGTEQWPLGSRTATATTAGPAAARLSIAR